MGGPSYGAGILLSPGAPPGGGLDRLRRAVEHEQAALSQALDEQIDRIIQGGLFWVKCWTMNSSRVAGCGAGCAAILIVAREG
jgi:hypothetical protein